jgi:hypothetical protein
MALAIYFLYFGQILELSYIRRKTNLIPFIFVILVAAPGTTRPLTETVPGWPLLLVKALLALVYFGSAYRKLTRSGLGWARGEVLQAYLVHHYLCVGTEHALRLARHRAVTALLSAGTLAFEATFWLILPFPTLTGVYVLAGLSFHAGTAVVMRIDYFNYFCLAYLVFAADALEAARRVLAGQG